MDVQVGNQHIVPEGDKITESMTEVFRPYIYIGLVSSDRRRQSATSQEG